MRAQDGLVGFASGLVVGVIIAWMMIVRLSLDWFDRITDSALLYSGIVLLLCAGIGVFVVYRYFQAWLSEESITFPITDSTHLDRFLRDICAIEQYRLLEHTEHTWIFQSLRHRPRWIDVMVTPLPESVEYLQATLTGTMLTLSGPSMARLQLKTIQRQIQARMG